MLNVRLDFRITKLLSIFKSSYDIEVSKGIENIDPDQLNQLVVNEAKIIFENHKDNAECFDFGVEWEQKFLRVLLKLMVEDYSPLVNGSLKLLLRHFSKIKETLITLKQLQLLVSQNDIENYIKIKTWSDKLRILVEKSELWIYHADENKKIKCNSKRPFKNIKLAKGTDINIKKEMLKDINKQLNYDEEKFIKNKSYASINDYKNDSEYMDVLKYKELYQILKDMISLSLNEVVYKNGTILKKPNKNNQRLLRNLCVHEIILDLTKISYEKMNDKKMRIIMKRAHEFLQNFCCSNSYNQNLLYEKIDFTNYPSNELEATTCIYIFKNNMILCNELNERLVQNCIQALENNYQIKDESKIAYLEFFQTVCLVDEHELKKNQDIIINELINSDIIHSSINRTQLEDILVFLSQQKEYYHYNFLLSSSNIDMILLIKFNLHLVKVLICCTIGKNSFSEIKCQTILSLEEVVNVITFKNCPIQLKDYYLKFLYHCYLETEIETREIFTQTHIWSLFSNFVEDMNRLLYTKENKYEFEKDSSYQLIKDYAANNIIDVLIGFFSHPNFNRLQSTQVFFIYY